MTIAEFFNKVGFKVNEGDVKKVNNTIADIKSTATKLLGAIGIGFSLTQLNALAEEFNGINDKLNYALEYSEDMKDVQKEILASANNCRMAYGSMVDTIVSLKQANADVFPINEAATFVEYLNKLGKSAGYSDGEISSMQSSIQRVVAAGTMGIADITRMARTTPALIEKICEGLGVTRDELEKMAAAGQITGATLKTAIMNSADSIDSAFDRLDYSISDAMLNIRNKWGYFVDDFNATTGLSQTIAKTMVAGFDKVIGVLNRVRNGVVWLSDKLGGMQNILKLVGIVAGVMFAGKALSGIMGFIQGFRTLDKAVLAAKAKMLAIIAVVVILALLVEDFINFMQGNDSVIGSLLEKAGIDTQKVRDIIIEAWSKIKDFLTAAWQTIKSALLTAWNIIKTAATTIFGGLQSFWKKHGEQIKASFVNVWNGIKNFLGTVWSAIKGLATVVFDALSAFWNVWGNTITTYFEGVWKTIKTVFSVALDLLIDLFAIFAALFAGDWEALWENIMRLASDLWKGITSVLTSIWNSTVETVGNIKDSIVEGFQEAIDWITSLPAQALKWGADIIQGIVDGITGAVGKVGEAAKGVADKIKSFLGFSEPEDGPLSDFHTYMPDMIQLMVEGIRKGKSVVNDAIRDLTGDMSSGMQNVDIDDRNPKKPKGGGWLGGLGNLINFIDDGVGALTKMATPKPATVSTVTGGNNVSRSVVQNVEINNEFNGDTPVQQKASKAMDKSAKDATSEMARALAFSR